MGFSIVVVGGDYGPAAASIVASQLPADGSLVLTGGTTAERVYPALADERVDLSGVEVFFSDERCVPPDDPASNFAMADRLLLEHVPAKEVHRMRGELDPDIAAAEYAAALEPAGALDLVLLGMGVDGHVCALYPGSPALTTDVLCAAVDRPDGLKGLTMTPPALARAGKVLLLVSGEAKAGTVRRAVQNEEPPERLPVRLLAGHPDVTFVLDEGAASLL